MLWPNRHRVHGRKHQRATSRITQAAIETLEQRQLLTATAWPGYAPSAWPANYNGMEIEAKWRLDITDEQIVEDIWAYFYHDRVVDMTSIGQSYKAVQDWSGQPRRYIDAYYDMPNGEVGDASHTLRHRQRYRAVSGQTPLFTWDLSALDSNTYWRTTPDKINVNYKSTPERFNANWFRMEYGSEDLTAAQASALLSGNYAQYPNYPTNNADNPILGAQADHPTIAWLGQSGAITQNVMVRQYRSRTDLYKMIDHDNNPSTPPIAESSPSYELSFDKVREYASDGQGNFTVLVDEYCIIEMAAEETSMGNVEDQFQVIKWMESTWSDLVADPFNKAGLMVSDHGPIVIDDGDRGYASTGTWVTQSGGHQNDSAYSLAGTGSDVATWDFLQGHRTLNVPLSPGRYKIGATWTAGSDRATNAPFMIYDGATLLGVITKNQTLAPAADFTLDGTNYENLGDTFYLSGTQLIVKLADNASNRVIADAIVIQHVDDAPLGISVASGQLAINGTSGADNITVAADAQGYVTVNGSRVAPPLFASAVTSILVESLEGDDTVSLASVNAGFSSLLSGNVTLRGGSGYDRIVGTSFGDRIYGDADTDWLNGQDGNDTVYGGIGHDIVYGGTGDDALYGEEGDDTLGSDWYTPNDGNDLMVGGAGGDNYWWNNANPGNDTVVEVATDPGADRADFYSFAAGVNFSLLLTTPQLVAGGSITLQNPNSIENISGSYYYSDTLSGDNRNNYIHDEGGQAGVPQYLYGNGGNDTLVVYFFGSRIDGGAGNDTLYGAQNGGNDTLVGGTGSDTYRYWACFYDGHDTIIEEDNVAGDIDTIDFTDKTGDLILDLAVTTPQNVWGTNLRLTLQNAAGNSQGLGIENVICNVNGVQNDTIYGNGRNNNIQTGPGADRIDGRAGNDTLYGGTDNDTLIGNAGNDTIWGGAGDDRIYGDTSNGTGQSYGSDYLYGEAGTDILWGDDPYYGGSSSGYGGAADTLMGGTGNDTLYGDGDWSGSGMYNGGNDWVHGDDGNDIVYGGYGNDIVYGGAGDDFVSGGYGDDYLYGMAGYDYIVGDDGSDHILALDYDGISDWISGGYGYDYLHTWDSYDNISSDVEFRY